jgi:hypothetical protein
MLIHPIHRELGSAFTYKTLDDFGVNWARSGRTPDPLVDRRGTDVEPLGEASNQ